MTLTNNAGGRAPIGHLLSPNEVSSAEIELHLIERLAKGVPWETLKN